MVRPLKKAGEDKYACPDGYLACNPKLLEAQQSQSEKLDYAMCYKEGEKEATCPITDIRFKESDKREFATYTEKKFNAGGD